MLRPCVLLGHRAHVLLVANWAISEAVAPRLGSAMKKIDCHRFSGIASQRVEWVDPNIEQVKREAPSLSFLQEKTKTLRIAWAELANRK